MPTESHYTEKYHHQEYPIKQQVTQYYVDIEKMHWKDIKTTKLGNNKLLTDR